MAWFIPGLDDEIVKDAQAGFVGGQQSFPPPDQIPQNAAVTLTNVDIIDGTATTRRGTEALLSAGTGQIQGLFWYDTPTRERLAAVVGGVLTEWDGSAWTPVAGYTAESTTSQICFAQLVDKLYIAEAGANLFQWDGTTLTDLGHALGAPGNPPEGAKFVISTSNRLWLAGFNGVTDTDSPDTLWASLLLDADANGWQQVFGNIRIGGGEGDPITGLIAWDDNKVVVLKRNSVYVVTADPITTSSADSTHTLGNATVTKLSENIGCVSHRSAARVGNDIWFLSDDGVFSLGRVIADNQREIKQARSLPVQDIIDSINWLAADTAAALFWDNRYMLSLPVGEETLPSVTLVYNTQRQAWSGLWTGWGPLCWTITRASGLERVVFGRSDSYVWQWLDYVPDSSEVEADFEDDGEPVATDIVTRAMIFNDAYAPKSLLNVRTEFFESQANATVGVRLDETEEILLASDFMTAAGVLLLPFTLPQILPNDGLRIRSFGGQHLQQFNNISVRVRSDRGKLAVRAVLLTGFPCTVRLEQ